MAKKALLVGINYPNTGSQLNGCVNDVMTMSAILTEHFGFEAKNKRMLTDRSATTDNIFERLDWLVDGAEVGDVLYFHFAGHGTQIVNTNYDSDIEPDGMDEIICPIDFDWRDHVITDDQMKAIFDNVPAGVNLTVVLDCCHSGSGLDQTNQYQPMGLDPADYFDPMIITTPNRTRGLKMPADMVNRGLGLDLQPKLRTVQTGTVNNTGLLISGCQSHQLSADAWIHNKYMGAATYFMTETLKDFEYIVDYKRLVEHMNDRLTKFGYAQNPELNGSEDLFHFNFLSSM